MAHLAWEKEGFHKSASELLAKERDIAGVGVETVGTDAGQAGTFDPPFPNHTTMHGLGKFVLESLRNLDQLPRSLSCGRRPPPTPRARCQRPSTGDGHGRIARRRCAHGAQDCVETMSRPQNR